MLKLCKVTKVKVLFNFQCWYQFFIQFNFNSFKSVTAILEKGLLLSVLTERMFKNQGTSSLVVIIFSLVTCMFGQEVIL